MMSDSFRRAFVYVRGVYAGTLEENEAGYSFRYDADYLLKADNPPVSLTLPLSEKEYQSKWLFPFFDGLIPEGWLLEVTANNWKIDPKDRFGILRVACRDAISIVSIRGTLE